MTKYKYKEGFVPVTEILTASNRKHAEIAAIAWKLSLIIQEYAMFDINAKVNYFTFYDEDRTIVTEMEISKKETMYNIIDNFAKQFNDITIDYRKYKDVFRLKIEIRKIEI